MPRVYEIDGIVPVIASTALVHPTAVLIGDVIVSPRCYVGPLASLRGDFDRLNGSEMSWDRDSQSVAGEDNRNPGDEASPGAPQTAENICRTCHGTGRVGDKPCPDCGGSGRIIETVGDA